VTDPGAKGVLDHALAGNKAIAPSKETVTSTFVLDQAEIVTDISAEVIRPRLVVVDSEALPPDERIRIAFAKAVERLDSPKWRGYLRTAHSTMRWDTRGYEEGWIQGFCDYLVQEALGLKDFLWGILKVPAVIIECAPVWLSDSDDVDDASGSQPLAATRCSDIRKAFHRIKLLSEFIPTLYDPVGSILRGVHLYQALEYASLTVTVQTLEVLASEEGEAAVHAWANELARDARRLGALEGTVAAVLVWEVGTAGLGSAVKAVKGAEKLATARTLGPAAEKVAESRRIEDWFQRFSDLLMSRLKKTRAGKIKLPPGLADDVITVARPLIGDAPTGAIDEVEHALAFTVEKLQNTVGPYTKLAGRASVENDKVLRAAYARAAQEGSEFDRAASTSALGEKLLEAHHIFEKRLFKRFEKELIQPPFNWKSEGDMAAVLLTRALHRNRLRTALKKMGIAIPELDEVEAVSTVLEKKIQFKVKGVEYPNDVLAIDKQTTLKEVIFKYQSVYSKESPVLYDSVLKALFESWLPETPP
jgi:hypothetical protein